MDARQFIRGLLYTRQEVGDWLANKAFPYGKYHPELGYIHRDRRSRHGIDGSVCTYGYDRATGARRTSSSADTPCRINSYGDSFTACDQVNDGETWQEFLAAHLEEPIRNFGVGGYSVYQTYLRMKLEEERFPAGYILMNIYDDDHSRNLVGWQRMRFGTARHHFFPPMPYVRANPAKGQFEEFANPCSKPQDLYALCDAESAYELFKDDFALRIILAKANAEDGTPEDSYKDIEELAEEYGSKTIIRSRRRLLDVANEIYRKSSIYASRRIIEKTERFLGAQEKKILYITSFSASSVAERLRPGGGLPVPERRRPGYSYSAEFSEFMVKRRVRWVDMMEAHIKDFSASRLSVAEYMKKYYVENHDYSSHYAPRGNYFTAFATKDRLVDLLDPKPSPYREVPSLKRWEDCVPLR